ncbi:unnamed protein product [Choristocarpus tenellus]
MSPIYPNPTEWWQLGFLIRNEPLRRLLESAENIVAKLDPVTKPWQGALFEKWYIGLYYRYFEAHRDAENEVWFPWLSSRKKLPPSLTGDDPIIEARVLEVKALAGELAKGCSGGGEVKDVAAVKTCAGKIRTSMRLIQRDLEPHLNFGEGVCGPIVRDFFTKEGEGVKVGHMLERFKSTGNSEFFAIVAFDSVLEWATRDQMEFFLESLPFVVSKMVKTWHPGFVNSEKKWGVDLLRTSAPLGDSTCVVS